MSRKLLLCVDVEDYYQCNDLDIAVEHWTDFQTRIPVGVYNSLRVLDETGGSATFFVVSFNVAGNAGALRQIRDHGHEIASHGHLHRLASDQQPAEFAFDLRRSVQALSSLIGCPILGYRAPSWSMPVERDRRDAFERILVDEGVRYDSSIVKWRGRLHVRGDPSACPTIHKTETGLVEVPAAVLPVGRHAWPFSLATVFRMSPLLLTVACILLFERRFHQPAMICVHTWDLDPNQPTLRLDPTARLLRYGRLASTLPKLRRLGRLFHFVSISETLHEIGHLAA